jgi:hypothetical protein
MSTTPPDSPDAPTPTAITGPPSPLVAAALAASAGLPVAGGATSEPPGPAGATPAPAAPSGLAPSGPATPSGSAPAPAAPLDSAFGAAARPSPCVVVALREPSPEAHRLAAVLRAEGAAVHLLAVPASETPSAGETVAELRRSFGQLATDLVRTLRGAAGESSPGPARDPAGTRGGGSSSPLGATLAAIPTPVAAVVAVDADVAREAFAAAAEAVPKAVRVAVDGTFHVSPAWPGDLTDAWVVSHAGLGAELPGVRSGLSHLLVGGLLGGGEVAPKRLDADRPMVVVSTERLDPGDVESLLFQLSMARPERFSLLFLPSGGQAGLDELIRVRAPNHGLAGKRPKPGASIEGWLRGAAVLVGHPTRAEAAIAVDAGVPTVLFAQDKHLDAGDRFLVGRGAALHADLPITLSVHIESLLPGGARRQAALEALKELEPGELRDAASAVMEAARRGRPAPAIAAAQASEAAAARTGSPDDDDLEDIGAPAAPRAHAAAAGGGGEVLSLGTRKVYLKELILHQHTLERQLAAATGGLSKWQDRVRLARGQGRDDLANQAVPRVEGLLRLSDRLTDELRTLAGVRDRLASGAPLRETDRQTIGRFMNAEVARAIARLESPESAFTELEIAEALSNLKKRLGG